MTGKSPVPKTKDMQITTTEVTGTLSLYPKRQHEIAMYQFIVTEGTANQVMHDFTGADAENYICVIRFSEIDGQSATVDLKEIELIRFVPAGVGA